MVCDICNRPGKHALVSSNTLRKAVNNGFNPFRLPQLRGASDMLGIPVDFQFQQWKQRLSTDTTDWNLCSNCKASVNIFLE